MKSFDKESPLSEYLGCLPFGVCAYQGHCQYHILTLPWKSNHSSHGAAKANSTPLQNTGEAVWSEELAGVGTSSKNIDA